MNLQQKTNKNQIRSFATRTWMCLMLAALFVALLLLCLGCGKTPDGKDTNESADETKNPPHVHWVSQWTTTREATLFENGEKQGVCNGCGETVTAEIKCATADLPRVYLTGDLTGITKDNRVTVGVEYVSPTENFSGYASMNLQGGSSAAYDWSKRNYNIRLFKDADLDKKLKVDVGFGKESKYCLKANFVDATHARNIVTARLWGEMIDTRVGVPEQLAAAPNGGAIDGFPVLLYVNDEWYGVYTLNIPKDEWMFNIHGEDTGAVFFMSSWSEPGKFKATFGSDHGAWELKYESDSLKGRSWDQLQNLIRFVVNSSDEEFVAHIDEYVDVNSVIDYIILICVSAAPDNTAKNMLLVTYDGQKFYVSPYDLDATWGLHWDGASFESESTLLPYVSHSSKTGYFMNPGADNLLFKRILEHWSEEFDARYRELRQTTLSNEHMAEVFKAFYADIPKDVLKADWENHPDIALTKTDTIRRITNTYIPTRMALLDERFDEYEAKKGH